MRIFLKILLVLCIVSTTLLSIALLICAILLGRVSNETVSQDVLETVQIGQKTEFFAFERDDSGDRIGDAIMISDASLNDDHNTAYITFDKMPKALINAFVAIEDKRFWSHGGIDYLRSTRAVINYIFQGNKRFGGSTITQQLVKNLTGNDRRLVSRKLSEAFAALNMESTYDKSEIIEMYLNVINLSHGCRGVGDAADYYFSKKVWELDLYECATLAAITNNPSKYDPIYHPDRNRERRNLIYSCMRECGYISNEDYETALCHEVKFSVHPAERVERSNSWYIDTVIEDVISDLARSQRISKKVASIMLYKGGYRIYTAVDMRVQNTMEQYFENKENFPMNSDGTQPQSSMIAIDPHSGDILGIVGAIGTKEGNRILNYSTDSKRPSGSAIKPISIYAPAIDKGIVEWSTVIEDSPVRVGNDGTNPWPSNADRKFRGNVTVDYAVKHSLNTVPVKILQMLGKEYAFDFLRDSLMITSLDDHSDMGDASLALGQHSIGISLRELVSAYSIFSDGIMKKSRSYYKVTDSNGRVILDNKSLYRQVISPESAAIMTKLLEGVVLDGTASSLIDLNSICNVAGKTGTTQYNFDRYFIGYTPTILAGVWQGYPSPRSLDFVGGNHSVCIWNHIVSSIVSAYPTYSREMSFSVPQGVQALSYNENGNILSVEKNNVETLNIGWYNIKNKRIE